MVVKVLGDGVGVVVAKEIATEEEICFLAFHFFCSDCHGRVKKVPRIEPISNRFFCPERPEEPNRFVPKFRVFWFGSFGSSVRFRFLKNGRTEFSVQFRFLG